MILREFQVPMGAYSGKVYCFTMWKYSAGHHTCSCDLSTAGFHLEHQTCFLLHLPSHSLPPPPLPPSPPLSLLFSAAVDKTAAIWDCEAAVRRKKPKGHTSFVSSWCPTRRGAQMTAPYGLVLLDAFFNELTSPR